MQADGRAAGIAPGVFRYFQWDFMDGVKRFIVSLIASYGVECFYVSVIGFVLLIVLLRMRRQRRRAIQAVKEGRDPRPYTRLISLWISVPVLVLMIVGALVVGVLLNPVVPKPANVGQPSDGWTGAAITLAVLGAIILGFGGYWLWAMWKTRVIRQALRVANAGDVASAIELLEQHVRQKGPSGPAYNALAVLRVKQERWDDALRDLDEAERLWGRRAVLLSNRGFILWKMGRPADALKPFEDAVHLKPKDIVLRCNHGCLLAELGRRGEAEEQLDRVARLAVEQKAHNQVVREARARAIDELRQKVHGGQADKE